MVTRGLSCVASSASTIPPHRVRSNTSYLNLGNTEHVLQAGVVCDGCNNYFASKVGGPLLLDPYFREQCSRAGILSKKRNLPQVKALHPQSRTVIELIRHIGGSVISVGVVCEKDEKRWVESVLTQNHGSIYVPLLLHPTRR